MAEREELEKLKGEIECLQQLLSHDILDESHAAECKTMHFEKKEKYVLSVHKTKIQEQKDSRRNNYSVFATRVNGDNKYTKARSYEELIEKLYTCYTGEKRDLSLKAIFPDAARWKSTHNVTGKTMKEYIRIWHTYIEPKTIASMKVTEIDSGTLYDFYDELCSNHSFTYKNIQSIRNVFSFIFDYCITKKLVKFSPEKSVNYKNLHYAKVSGNRGSIKKTPFPVKKIPDILAWCQQELERPKVNPLHPYGIIIGLAMGDRYGELKGLRWSNVDLEDAMLTVEDQAVPTYTMKDDLTFCYEGRKLSGHIKGYEDPVSLPIPEEALEAFKAIRDLHLDEEFVFPENHFRQNTFNNTIKRMAQDLHLDAVKYSSHSLRTTAATNLYLKTHDIFQVQMLLHHTTPEMTMKYVKNLEIKESLKASMLNNLLSVE